MFKEQSPARVYEPVLKRAAEILGVDLSGMIWSVRKIEGTDSRGSDYEWTSSASMLEVVYSDCHADRIAWSHEKEQELRDEIKLTDAALEQANDEDMRAWEARR
jgi:hypothetical protein